MSQITRPFTRGRGSRTASRIEQARERYREQQATERKREAAKKSYLDNIAKTKGAAAAKDQKNIKAAEAYAQKTVGGASKFASKATFVLGLAMAAKEAGDEIAENTRRLQANNQALASYSAQMASVMAQREVEEIKRQREQGDAVSASADFLSDGENYRKNNQQDIVILLGKIENTIGGLLEFMLGTLLAPINDIARIVNKFDGERDLSSLTLGEWTDQMRSLDEISSDIKKASGK